MFGGVNKWRYMTPGSAKFYAWLEILTLPLKFFCSEFFMFNRDQLVLIAKLHRFVMCIALAVLSSVLVVTLVEAQNDRTRMVQELDRHDIRITDLEKEVKSIRIDQAVTTEAFRGMTEKMNAGLGLLGVIATTLLCQFGMAVFRMKWGTALRETIAQEYDRRKIKTHSEEE